MGGGQQAPASQIQGTSFRPEQDAAIQSAFGAAQQGGNQAVAGVQQAIQGLPNAPTLQSNFSQFFDPSGFNTNFQTQGGLDARSQALVSQNQAQGQAGVAAQQRALQRQLGGSNPGLANVLGQQAQTQALLASNPAYFQAGQQQESRVQQERQLQNQAMLQSTEARSQLQQAGNAAQLDQFDAGQANAAMQANLSSLLAQIPQSTLAALFGTGQGMGSQFGVTPQQAGAGFQTTADGQTQVRPTILTRR